MLYLQTKRKHVQKSNFIILSLSLPFCFYLEDTLASTSYYYYDALNRLVSANYETTGKTNYSYDAAGNLLQISSQKASSLVLEGYITDDQGNPLADINVTVANKSTTTDETGHYKITDLPTGNYVLWASGKKQNFSAINISLEKDSHYDIKSDGSTECLLYAVHDEKRSDSQLFTINPESPYIVSLLGSLHLNADLESLAFQPSTNQLYSVSGKDGEKPGALYAVNAITGDIHLIGNTGFKDINGLSFSLDGQLWGWAVGKGLITIDVQTGKSELVLPYGGKVEDLTWDVTNKNLYVVKDNYLYSYEPFSQMVQLVCNAIDGNEVEGLEILPNGYLLFSQHQDQELLIRALDVNSCGVLSLRISTQRPDITLDDVEGIAWPSDVCQ